jgi:hypothetical protein
MSRIDVRTDRIEKLFRVLEGIGNLGQKREDGFLRASWSDEESRAMDLVRRTAEEEGMTSFHDAVGNLFVATPGDGSEIVYTGSHLDTVPMGGNYDGGERACVRPGGRPRTEAGLPKVKKRLASAAWRARNRLLHGGVQGKPGRFVLSDRHPRQKFRGKTLEEAIRGKGFDPAPSRTAPFAGRRDPLIAALVELHIEQASSSRRGRIRSA